MAASSAPARSPEREALAEATARRREAEAEPGRREAAASRLSESVASRRDEIEQLSEELARLREAHRNWRITEALDDPVSGPAPGPIEPVLQRLGRAEDDAAALTEAAEEARRRAAEPGLQYRIEVAKRDQTRALAALIKAEWGAEWTSAERGMLVRAMVAQLHYLGIPVWDLLLVSSEQSTPLQRHVWVGRGASGGPGCSAAAVSAAGAVGRRRTRAMADKTDLKNDTLQNS